MENITAVILEIQNIEDAKLKFISDLRYEKVLNDFLKKLGLRANQCQLIRAFMDVSQGEAQFEASYSELSNILFDKDSASKDTLNKRVENRLNVLLRWQEMNNLQLIRVTEKGNRILDEKKRFSYQKSKYELVMLKGFFELVCLSSEMDLDEDLENFIVSLRSQFKPTEQKKKYHPRHQIKKNKMNILTKFKRNFELLIEAGENPIDYCQKTLNEVCKLLNEMEERWTEQCNQESLISEFENLIDDETKTDEEDLGLKS